VQPLIEEAKKSVSGISSSNLNELASLPKPPEAVKNVLKVVVRIFGEYTEEWNGIKSFIENKSFVTKNSIKLRYLSSKRTASPMDSTSSKEPPAKSQIKSGSSLLECFLFL
jgi:hypothetical protein